MVNQTQLNMELTDQTFPNNQTDNKRHPVGLAQDAAVSANWRAVK